MISFTNLEGAYALVRYRGVYRVRDIFIRDRGVYVAHGNGYARCEAWPSTSVPGLIVCNIDWGQWTAGVSKGSMARPLFDLNDWAAFENEKRLIR